MDDRFDKGRCCDEIESPSELDDKDDEDDENDEDGNNINFFLLDGDDEEGVEDNDKLK